MLNPYVALPLLMATEKFRRQLRHESEQWWAEGLIDADLHARLADRYQFSALEQDASNRFVVILMGLGAILVGLGAITFVAANWQAWSRSLKIVLLLSLFVSVNATGFYLWRRVDHRRAHTLGQGLLLLGALILGANLSLLSQMFHQSGNFYHLLLVWGIGVLAMAYSLRLTSLSVLALILLAWGYSLGWIAEAVAPTASIWAVLVQHMPLFSSLLLIPLAHWCRSRIVFALAASLVAASLVFNLRPLAGWWAGQLAAPGWLITIAFILPPALLWSYDRRFWTWSWSRFRRSPPNSLVPAADSFQPIAHSLTIWFLSLLFYSLSFYWLWNRSPASQPVSYSAPGAVWIDAVLLSILAGLGWLSLLQQRRRSTQRSPKSVHTGMVASLLLLTAAVLLWHTEIAASPALITLAFNGLFFGLAIALIRDGLALGNRHTFWGGMVLLILGIISRMLEYNTGLLAKSIVFALCGIGVIGAGLWFERHTRPRVKG